MNREHVINMILLLGLVTVPLWAMANDAPFTIWLHSGLAGFQCAPISGGNSKGMLRTVSGESPTVLESLTQRVCRAGVP